MDMKNTSFDFSDWILAAVGWILVSITAGVGSAMAWFRQDKQEIYKRLAQAQDELHLVAEQAARHHTEMEVLKSCNENIRQHLDGLQQNDHQISEKLDRLMAHLLDRRGGSAAL